jgi:hypothetical protein
MHARTEHEYFRIIPPMEEARQKFIDIFKLFSYYGAANPSKQRG